MNSRIRLLVRLCVLLTTVVSTLAIPKPGFAGRAIKSVGTAPDGSIFDLVADDLNATQSDPDFPGWVWGIVYSSAGLPIANAVVTMVIPGMSEPITTTTGINEAYEQFPMFMFGTLPYTKGAKRGMTVTMSAAVGGKAIDTKQVELRPDNPEQGLRQVGEVFVEFGRRVVVNFPSAEDTTAFSAPDTIVPYRSISAGANHTCMATPAGNVLCWGDNRWGQLGNNTTSLYTQAVTVTLASGEPLAGAYSVAAGWEHTCALLEDGGVRCWGRNTSGQLGVGNNPITRSLVPVEVVNVGDIGASSISAGGNHTCVTTVTNIVLCWGDNAYGQIGKSPATPIEPQPTVVASEVLTNVRSLYGGREHTCALSNDGVVY